MSALITHLKSKQLLWQASQTTPVTDKIATGIDLLDKALQGGFPKRGLARIHSTMGIGELRLCMPVLKQRQQDQRQLFIIAPPASINAEMLHEYKLSIERTFFINSENQAGQLWACEQCLKSGCAHSVVFWCNHVSLNQAKRLQIAAEQGNSLLLLYQYGQAVETLPVNLSLSLSRHEQNLRINITKQRGGWPVSALEVQQTFVSLRGNKKFDKQTTADNVVALYAH